MSSWKTLDALAARRGVQWFAMSFFLAVNGVGWWLLFGVTFGIVTNDFPYRLSVLTLDGPNGRVVAMPMVEKQVNVKAELGEGGERTILATLPCLVYWDTATNRTEAVDLTNKTNFGSLAKGEIKPPHFDNDAAIADRVWLAPDNKTCIARLQLGRNGIGQDDKIVLTGFRLGANGELFEFPAPQDGQPPTLANDWCLIPGLKRLYNRYPIKVVSLKTGEVADFIDIQDVSRTYVAGWFSQDGRKLALHAEGNRLSRVHIYDLDLKKRTHDFEGGPEKLAWSPDGKSIAFIDSEGVIQRNLDTGLVKRPIREQVNEMMEIHFTGDGKRAFINYAHRGAGAFGGAVDSIFSSATHPRYPSEDGSVNLIGGCAGDWSGANNGALRVWEVEDASPVQFKNSRQQADNAALREHRFNRSQLVNAATGAVLPPKPIADVIESASIGRMRYLTLAYSAPPMASLWQIIGWRPSWLPDRLFQSVPCDLIGDLQTGRPLARSILRPSGDTPGCGFSADGRFVVRNSSRDCPRITAWDLDRHIAITTGIKTILITFDSIVVGVFALSRMRSSNRRK